jgi:ParB/RepB/Spo0J family partition protein
MTEQFAQIGLSLIAPSLTNPRKTFNQVRLQELADNIKASGVHTPVLVRMLPGHRAADTERSVIYELVAGERRYRASEMAGVDTIPALIRPLTDDQVLEIQLVENLHRDDLTALEEAEGYEALMEHTGMTAVQVGEKINKSRTYVYNQLKLLDLCSEARVSLRDGSIDPSRALVVARIPDHKLQIKAMKEIVDGHGYSSPREPMTYRQALEHVQRNYMLKLGEAKFKITNAELVPAAGSCKTCTKRTGHDPDLFSDVKGADVCTDPPCFHKKEEAHAAVLVKEAKDRGQTVIAGKEAKELLTNHYDTKFKGYKRLDSTEDSPTGQPLRKIIGQQMEADGIKPTMIESAKGVLVACLPNEVSLQLLKRVEGQAAAAKTVAKEVRELVDSKKAKVEAKATAAYEQEWRDQLVARTWQSIERIEDPMQWFTEHLHRFIALKTANNLSTDQSTKVAELIGLDKVGSHSALIDHVKTTEDPERVHLLMIMVRDSSANDLSYSDRVANEGMHLVAEAIFQNGLQSTLKDIKSEALAKHFPKVKEQKVKVATAPAARPKEGAGGKKAVKLSAEEATLGIAAAMQGIDGAASAPVGAVALPAEPAGDPLLATAVKVVVREQKATVRLLKTELSVGTSKAMELMDLLQKAGTVSACDERGARKVLVAA